MSTVVPLPPEILQFLARPLPQSMLLRGPPGSGKSTLSLALLEAFSGRRIYVSSRLGGPELTSQHPWIRAPASGIRVVDDAIPPGSIREARRVQARAREVLSADDEAGVQSLWLPGPLLDAWSQARPESPSMVVIDSWDALVEGYVGVRSPDSDLPDRAELERLLLAQMARGAVMTVLVLERSEPSQLDYLVNGVLSLRSGEMDERTERWLSVQKLRGVRISTSAYPFTLEGGRFSSISPVTAGFPASLPTPEPEPDRQPEQLWPGSSEFASEFGRLRHRSISLLRTFPGVPNEAVRMLVGPLLAQVLDAGGRVVLCPPPGLSPEQLWELGRSRYPEEQLLRQLRIVAVAGPPEDEPEPVRRVMLGAPQPPVAPHASRVPAALRFFEEVLPRNTPNLLVLWMSGVRSLGELTGATYSPSSLPALIRQHARLPNTHVFVIGEIDDPLTDALRPLSHIRLRMQFSNGRVFVYGVNPLTPLHVLSVGNGTPYQLLRVV